MSDEDDEPMDNEEQDNLPDVTMEPSWKALGILPCSVDLEQSEPEKADKLFEDAIQDNPGSYKLWHAFLLFKTRLTLGKTIDNAGYEHLNACYERALVFMHRMPRIWMEYCTLLTKQLFVTRARRAFDQALEALPITQHPRIWTLYVEFIKQKHVPVETAVRVFKRFMQLQPDDAETFIDYLHSKNRTDEATALLCDIINRPNFQSKKDKTKYQLWEELCDMLCEYADQIQTVDAEAVLRDGIARYPDQQGKLWNSLARYYIQMGMFSRARDVYDEAIHSVTTKKDFVEVWEAYTNFEEKHLEYLLSQDHPTPTQLIEIEMRQTMLEELITNNGLLLSRVALRQNPHNVREWQRRALLWDQLDDSDQAKEETFVEAIRTVNPSLAVGDYEDLWIDYAKYHIDSGRPDTAVEVFEKALEAEFPKLDQLAKVWCVYIEFKLSINQDEALALARRATKDSIKNLRIWSLYVDLEENFGNFELTKAAYDRILELRIATPQIILNYGAFMEERNYFEETFRIYEKGVSLFRWPISSSIWHTYLSKFFARYGYKKLDRSRDILEQCLKDCPPDHSLEFYLLYAKLEEEVGLVSRARDVYSRGAYKVSSKHKADLFRIFVKSMMKLVDIDGVRAVYEQAIAGLDNRNARTFCLEYANLEEELGEVDRARTIYSFCSQMCDPKTDREFWAMWADFEQKHGSLESIDEMLRIKRSVGIQNVSTV